MPGNKTVLRGNKGNSRGSVTCSSESSRLVTIVGDLHSTANVFDALGKHSTPETISTLAPLNVLPIGSSKPGLFNRNSFNAKDKIHLAEVHEHIKCTIG